MGGQEGLPGRLGTRRVGGRADRRTPSGTWEESRSLLAHCRWCAMSPLCAKHVTWYPHDDGVQGARPRNPSWGGAVLPASPRSPGGTV